MGSRPFLPLCAALCLTLGCVSAPPAAALGADAQAKFAGPARSVCADGSGDHTTIQAAINAALPFSTITVCPGTYSEHLRINGKSLTLVSDDGAAATIIDGGSSGTVLTAFMIPAPGLSVAGFTLQNGSGPNAGGLQCFRATVSLADSVVDGNTGGAGAGLMARLCTLDLDGVTVTDNVATSRGGGAYYLSSAGTVTGSTFDGNEADEGGGLALSSSPVEVSGSTFTGNHASTVDEELNGAGSGGGGVWIYGDATLSGNTISDNTSGYNGGGLYVWTGAAEIADNVISDNYSGEDGGGAYASQSSAWFHDNTVSGNEAFDDAGGLRIYVGSMTVEDNLFDSNTAADDGGGLKLSHSAQTLRRNTFTDNVAGDAGGGLELDNETSTIEDCIFDGNSATRGGGLHSWRNEGPFTIVGAVITDNTASDCGGGIQLDNDPYTITLSQTWLEGNTALDGGGLCVDEVELEDGGYEDTLLALVNTGFFDNTATDDGGGLYLKSGSVSMVNSVVSWNVGANGSGVVLKSGTLSMTNDIIYRNQDADGIVVEGGTLTSTFTDVYGHWGYSNWNGTTDPAGTQGNISENPMFPWGEGGLFTLDATSPCIDTGNPLLVDPDGSRSDMGMFGGTGGDW